MPSGKIPFGSAVVKNTDEIFVEDGGVSFFDGFLNERGVSVKRPCLTPEISLGASNITGLFWWPTQKSVVAVANGGCYVITRIASAYSVTNVTSAVPSIGRCYFAYDDDYFYLSDGGKIMSSDGTATSLTDLADANAPTSCSHVSFLDGYIIGNNNNKTFQFSAYGDGLTWDALDVASAIGNPDNVIGQVVFNRQIFLIGNETTEVWYNDGESPFSRADGGFIERGCMAPSSILKTKAGVVWLDNERNLVISNGGAPEVLSGDYKKEIDSLLTPSDCETHFIEYNGRQFLLLNFISDQRTMVYNMTTPSWSEWGYWDSAAGEYLGWKGRSYLWVPDWGVHLVGTMGSSSIMALKDTVYQDNSEEVRFYKRTGFVNHGSDALKRCERVTIKVARGYGSVSASSSPILMLRWRDDGDQQWSTIEEIDLGKAGDPIHHIEVYPRGAYRSRQWELSCTENVPLSFLDADETYSVLR